MKQIITDEEFEVVVSLRFAPSYRRQFIRKFIRRQSKRIQKLSVQLWSVNQGTTEAEEVTDS
jgi:hypothetical protein